MDLNHYSRQASRLLHVTRYLLQQYRDAFRSGAEGRSFLTEMYLRAVPESRRPPDQTGPIPARRLAELFPGIERVPVQVRAWLDTHEQGGFSEETPYLVAGEELLALCALVAWRRPRILFEIGTNRGWTCAALATNSPEAARILTLDIEEMPLADAEVSRCFRDRGIVRLRADSSTFDFSPYHADFVFVDARHESPWVDRDTETALRMVRDGGLVVWHDYGPEHPDVVTCLDRLATKVSLCRIAGTSLVVYRGPPAVSRRRPSTKSGQIES